MLSLLPLATGILVVLFAGITQGLTSFGFALIAVPFLSMLVPIAEVVPIVVILSLGTNLIMLSQTFRRIEFRKIGLLVVSSLIAVPFGTLALIYIVPNTIKAVVGVVIILVSGVMLTGMRFPVRSEKIALVPIGMLSGFLNGSISMSGPPVALFMSNQNEDKEVFRANLTIYATILNVFTITSFIVSGVLTSNVIAYSVWLIPAMIVGVLLGGLLETRINQTLFKRIALCLILASGIWTMIGVFVGPVIHTLSPTSGRVAEAILREVSRNAG